MKDQLNKELLELAASTPYPLHQVRELYRVVLDVEKLRRILNHATDKGISPYSIVECIESFKDSTTCNKLNKPSNRLKVKLFTNRDLVEIILGIGIVIVFSFISYKMGYLKGEKDTLTWVEQQLTNK